MIIKICGITTAEDATASLSSGSDWIGLNLVAGPRRITLPSALSIIAETNEPERAVVLVSVRDTPDFRRELGQLRSAGTRRLQLYGAVTPSAIERLQGMGFETLSVHGLGDERDLLRVDAFIDDCGPHPPTHVLIDAAGAAQLGGTGRLANWNAIAAARHAGRLARWPSLVLAGGLTPENVADAVNRVAPFGVDVSSGVEAAPGRKDLAKVAQFVHNARSAADPLG